MYSQPHLPRLSGLSCLALLLLCLINAIEGTHIEIYSDSSCQNKTDGWNGPNGYPNGRCTSLKRDGNFTSFMITHPDAGCAITLYAKDKTQDICSGSTKIGTPSTCYDATWYYYSIDECFTPGGSSLSASSASSTSSSTSTTSSPTTLHTHTRTSSSATATPTPHNHGPNIGAIVGGTIGGVAAGAILAAIGIISFIRYRRTRRAKDGRNRNESAPPPYGHGPVEVAAKEAPLRNPGTWSSHPTTPAHELGDDQAVELQTNLVHELPDSGRGELGQKSPTPTQGSDGPILQKNRKE